MEIQFKPYYFQNAQGEVLVNKDPYRIINDEGQCVGGADDYDTAKFIAARYLREMREFLESAN
jgi:hypothetical protein